MVFLLTVYSLLALKEPHIKNFLVEASKSGQIRYAFVEPADCPSGKLKNAYALSQNGKIFLKQLSSDGSLGSVCVK